MNAAGRHLRGVCCGLVLLAFERDSRLCAPLHMMDEPERALGSADGTAGTLLLLGFTAKEFGLT